MRPFSLGRVAASVSVALIVLSGCDGQPLEPTARGALASASASQPAAPSNVSAVEGSPGRMTVSWRDNATNETGFEVYRSAPGDTSSTSLLATTGANVTTYLDTGLAVGTRYCYAVRAVRVTGNKSASYSSFAALACVTTVTPPPPTPAAPSGLAAVASSPTQVGLAWQDNSSNESSFQIFRSTTGVLGTYDLLATTGANAVSYSDGQLASQQEYCYRVRAVATTTSPAASVNSYSTYSDPVCALTPAPPPPPPPPPVSGYTVSARPLASNYVEVKAVWTNASSPRTEFRLYRSMDGGATWELSTLPVDFWSGTAWDYPLQSEQRVCYRVVGYTSAGDAPPSNAACTAPPAGPYTISATAVDADSLQLTWSDDSGVEDGYEVWLSYYRPTMGCYNGTGAVDTGTLEGETLVATLPANTTSYRVPQMVDNTCIPATTYSYYVVAVKDGGRGDAASVSASVPTGATTLGARVRRPVGRRTTR